MQFACLDDPDAFFGLPSSTAFPESQVALPQFMTAPSHSFQMGEFELPPGVQGLEFLAAQKEAAEAKAQASRQLLVSLWWPKFFCGRFFSLSFSGGAFF